MLFLIAMFATSALAQKTVTGVVSDDSGEPLPGASVVIKGTTQGVITDLDGNYSISVPEDASILIFSFVGMETQEVVVGSQSVINVTMVTLSIGLDEVVVTALGLTREKKSLGYSVGEVGGEDLSNVAQENVLNSLAGRVSGVQISSTGASAGSSVSIVIRGATSLAGDNQPLFVVDGVPINNQLKGNSIEIGSRNVVDYGNAISDLNTQDIESVSILKGPSAAALYGSRAGNGVVLITTKTGKRGKDVSVNFSSSVVFDQPYKFYDKHDLFSTGVRTSPPPGVDPPVVEEDGTYAMGLPLDKGIKAIQWSSPLDENGNPIATELVSYPDNFKNFVQTGVTTDNNLSITGGSDKSAFRISVTNMTNKGIIPNSDLFRTSLNLSGTHDLTKNLTLSTNFNIGKTKSNNRPAGNRGTNPLQHLVYMPSHINILDLQDYWEEGQEEIQQRQVPDHNNPYFLAYAVNNNFFRDRVFGNIKLDWQITPEINIKGRFAMDRYNEERETKIPMSYDREPNGAYGVQKIYRRENNADILATYNKGFGGFSLNASVGGNIMYKYNTFATTASRNRGTGLIVPGLYTVSNINPLSLSYSSSWYQKAIYSVYGLASLGYKSMVYLDLTARNDWSSTLPEENRSYFYPAASLSMLINNIVELPSLISLLKLRTGWAQVGNDTDPYRLEATMSNPGSWGGTPRLDTPSYLLSPDLKPEIATSIEFGTDIALFENRLRFDATYYKAENENQILSVILPMSSGYSSKLINAGLLESKGWDASLGLTPVKSSDLLWDLNFVFTRNRTKITELAEGIEYYRLWSDAKGGAYTFVGEEIGIIRDRAMVTVEDPGSEYYGWPLLDDEGSWDDVSTNPAEMAIIGNFNPDFTMGIQTSLSYKDFTLSMSFDWRKGGQFVSQTYRYTESDLISQRFMDNLIDPTGISDLPSFLKSDPEKYIIGIHTVGGPTREMGGYYLNIGGWEAYDGTFNPGVYGEYDTDGNLIRYVENLGGPETLLIPLADNYPWSFTKPATFDADFIKLREIALAYQIPLKGIKSLTVSIYSRNIVLWTKAKIGIDPETAFQPESGTFKQGIERYNVTPWVIPIGFKVNVGF